MDTSNFSRVMSKVFFCAFDSLGHQGARLILSCQCTVVLSSLNFKLQLTIFSNFYDVRVISRHHPTFRMYIIEFLCVLTAISSVFILSSAFYRSCGALDFLQL